MLRRWLHRTIRNMERRFSYDAAYMHDLIEVAPGAMLKLALVQPLNQHRRGVSRAAWHAARITAARHEDCGPCTQLVLDMALADGVAADQLRALVSREFGAMSEDVALCVRLADAVATSAPADELRAEIVRRFGQDGLISLSFAIAGARIFPTLKRALGHARACERLRVSGDSLPAARVA
jgi:hypothetical protein